MGRLSGITVNNYTIKYQKRNILTIHVADNIDWENKSVTRQTYNTNSILIQHINDSETRNSSIQLKPDYEFDRKQDRLYKRKSIVLPHYEMQSQLKSI